MSLILTSHFLLLYNVPTYIRTLLLFEIHILYIEEIFKQSVILYFIPSIIALKNKRRQWKEIVKDIYQLRNISRLSFFRNSCFIFTTHHGISHLSSPQYT